MSDDITFCASECNNKKCFRHSSNIQKPRYPHSFAMFKNTDTCPLYKKTMTIDEAIKHCKEKAEKYRELIITKCEDGREFYNPVAEECAREHEQLAEWLTELKARREEAENDSRTDFDRNIQ